MLGLVKKQALVEAVQFSRTHLAPFHGTEWQAMVVVAMGSLAAPPGSEAAARMGETIAKVCLSIFDGGKEGCCCCLYVFCNKAFPHIGWFEPRGRESVGEPSPAGERGRACLLHPGDPPLAAQSAAPDGLQTPPRLPVARASRAVRTVSCCCCCWLLLLLFHCCCCRLFAGVGVSFAVFILGAVLGKRGLPSHVFQFVSL